MGGVEAPASAGVEPPVRYHSSYMEILNRTREAGPVTVLVGQFNWGGFLLKSNGGAQWFPQAGWQSAVERKGIRELDCETDRSSRCESRP